jgi:hypothetical protein
MAFEARIGVSDVTAGTCLICDFPLDGEQDFGGYPVFSCPRCGQWAAFNSPPDWMGWTIVEQLGQADDPKTLDRKSRLSHIVRRQQAGGNIAGVRADFLPAWGLNQALPSPFEQLDDLILWIGDHQPGPNEPAVGTFLGLSAWVGSRLSKDQQPSNFYWILDQPEINRYVIRSVREFDNVHFNLTMDGWSYYKNLKDQHVRSNFAFMALKFGDEELDQVVSECFAPAVAKAGFELRTLADHQGAGLIDDQLRVALRNCRFVIADVTHGNNGAYWEAGFAEGLGKPVIYTCRQSEWEERKVHFDTNHLVTIIWSPDDLDFAAVRLTATIRATLPAEAKLTDA